MNNIKRMIVGLVAAFGITSISNPSHALLIEPIIGYGTNTVDVGTSDDAPTNLYYGIRLGTDIVDLGFASLFTALDYRTGNGTLELGGIFPDLDYTHTLTGLDVGLDLPLVRVWLGYFFTNTFDFEGSTIEDYEGDGAISVGLGLGFIPFVEVSVELINSSDDDTDIQSLLVNVSVPIDI